MNASPEIVCAAAFMVVVVVAIVRVAKARASRQRTRDAVEEPAVPVSEPTNTSAPHGSAPDVVAALLAPLGVTPWNPPDIEASPDDLADASLHGRISAYEPRPEPLVVDDHHEPWVVDSVGLAALEPGQRVGTVEAPWAHLVPEVHVTETPQPAIADADDIPAAGPPAASPEPAEEDLQLPAPHLDSPEREGVADIVLAAPVELWFGDSRVGVREGSKTYEQFRKFADAMLFDLNAAKDSSR